MKKVFYRACFFFLFFIGSRAWAYYFQDNFVNDANWYANLRYNVALGVWTNVYDATGRIDSWSAVNNQFVLDGDTLMPVNFTATFYGIYALFTNRSFNASVFEPFGYEITRYRVQNDMDEASWLAGVINIGMAQETVGVTNGAGNGMNGPHFARTGLISEVDWQQNADTSYYSWREKGFTNSKIPLTAVTNLAGITQNLSPIMEVDYNAGINTTEVRFRIVNDGNYLYWYVNPNPNGATPAYSNTFYLISKTAVDFSNNLQPLMGSGTISDRSNYATPLVLEMTNFEIRTIASAITSVISPLEAIAGDTNKNLSLKIQPVFSDVNEAGIQEFYVRLPDAYRGNGTNWYLYTNRLSVSVVTNGGGQTNTKSSVFGDRDPGVNQVALTVQEGGALLKVRFSADAQSEVFHPDNLGGLTAANQSFILLTLSNFFFVPGADSSGNRKFEVYVNNEKYSDTTWAKTATTGRVKSRSAMIAMPGGDYDSLSIRTVNPIDGVVASVRPGKPDFIYEGVSTTVYYDVSVRYSTNNNADVSKVELIVPDGFDFDPASLYSEQLDPIAPSVLTNGSEIKIVADYDAQGRALVAGNGFDTIRFNLTGTTNFDNTNQVEVKWTSLSYSTLFSTATTNVTNALYPVQTMIVRKKPPVGEVSLVALDGITEKSTIRNTLISNQYRMNLRNLGDVGNNIKRVLIQMDPAFVEVFNASDDLFALISVQTNMTNQNITNNSGFVWLTLDYEAASTNLRYNGIDVLYFWAKDEIAPLTNDLVISNFAVYADNGNGDGWIAFNEIGGGLSLTFVSPDPQVVGYIESPVEEGGDQPLAYFHQIYSDWTEKTNVRFYIENAGEPGNAISSVRLAFPTNAITNFSTILSINKGGVITLLTNGSKYEIQVDYTNGSWLEANEGSNASQIWDEIQMDIWDRVERATNITVTITASNVGSNYVQGGNYGSDNLTLHFIEAPVVADSYVEVPGGFVAAETNRYSVSYYLRNLGRSGNDILKAFVYIPTNYITNVEKVSNNTALGAGIFKNPSPINGYWRFDLTYLPGAFPGGASDVFAFEIFDNVLNSQRTVTVTASLSNRRWLTNTIGVTPSQTQDIFIMPPPTSFGYGIWPNVFHNALNNHTNTNRIVVSVTNSGKGSNLLNRFRVSVPSEFVGKILALSNRLTAQTNTTGVLWVSNGNDVWMDYTAVSTNLPAGQGDELYLDVLTDHTNTFDSVWEVWAQNNSTTEDLTNTGTLISNHGQVGSNVVSVVDKPFGYVVDLLDGDNEFFTTATEDYLKYKIQNGNSAGGQKIKNLYFAFPDAFGLVNPSSVSNDNSGITVETFTLNTTNFVKVKYAVGLGPAEIDYIYLTVPDSITIESNFVVPFFVDYGDTNRWFSTDVETAKSNRLVFVDPPPQGEAYTSPHYVSQDFISNRFTFYLTNKGILGNHIYAAQIIAPPFMTNLIGVSSSVASPSQIFIDGGTNVRIYYTNTILSNGAFDQITLWAMDDISAGTNDLIGGAWKFRIDNTVNLSGFVDVLIKANESLDVSVVKPAYLSRISIEASNSISPENPGVIYSTAVTNYLKFSIENRSGNSYGINSLVTRAKIVIPDLLNLSTLKVTNLAWQGISNYLVGRDLYLVYTNPMPSYTNDTVLLTVVDQVGYINTNFDWNAEVAYDSTMDIFKPASKAVGKSLNIAYIMPEASVLASTEPNSLWQDYPGESISLWITNTADEINNAIYYVKVTAPSFVTNIQNVSSSAYSGIFTYQLSGGNVLELYYTNGGNGLPQGKADQITLQIYDDISTPTNTTISGVWSVEAKNTSDFSSTNVVAGIPLGKTRVLNVNAPDYSLRYSIEATNCIAGNENQLLSTIVTNYLQLNLKNTSQSGDKVFRIQVPIPAEVDGSTLSLLNWNNGSNTVQSGYLTLYYTNALLAGSNDTILFRVLDLVNNASTNAYWTNLQAAYDTTFTNYREATPDPLKFTFIAYVMPQASAVVYATPNEIWQDFPPQRHQIWISNTASDTKNDIYFAEVSIPGFFTNLVSIDSTNYSDLVAFVSNQKLYLYYTNTPMAAGQFDVIHFTALDDIQTPTNSLLSNWVVKIDNATDGSGLRNADTWISKSLEIGILKPNYNADYYLVATNSVSEQQANTLYSTLETNYIKFVLINRQAGNLLQRAELILPDVIDPAEIEVLSHSWPGVTNFITNRVIVFDFTNRLIAGTNDTIYLRVNDLVSNRSTNHTVWTALANFDTTADIFKPIGLLAGRTNSFDYYQPPVSAKGYSSPHTVSQDFPWVNYTIWITNTGLSEAKNNITLAEIDLPSEITNVENITSVKGGIAQLTGQVLKIFYTNNTLKPGETDTIAFKGWDSVSSNSADVHTNFTVVLYNTSDWTAGLSPTAVNLESFDLDLIRYPYGAAAFVESQTNLISAGDLNRMYSTLITNRLKFALYNTGLSGNPLIYARIKIPSTVDTNTLVITRLQKTNGVTNFISNNFIYLIYTNNHLLSGDFDEILLDFNDTVEYQNTNVEWTTEAAFTTTYTNFKPVSEYPGKLLSFSYVMPDAKMQGWMTPNEVSQDFDSFTYDLWISNTATEAANHIYRVEIEFPVFVTNASAFVSTNNAGLTWEKSASNQVSIYYTNQALAPGDWDRVTFTAWDWPDGGDTNVQDTWKVRADNTKNASGEKEVTLAAGKSFSLAVTLYPYAAKGYVEAEGAISADKTTLDATEEHTILTYTLYNKGGAGNLLTSARIQIPSAGTWINTNTMTLTNLRKSGATIGISNGFIVIDYSGSPIDPNDYDQIRIEYDEKILTNNVSLTWNAEAGFNTTDNKLKPVAIYSGKNNVLNYVMPAASAWMSLQPSEIYVNRNNFVLKIALSNSGTGSDRLNRIELNIPAPLTNALTVGQISSSNASSLTYANGLLSLEYTNFITNTSDEVELNLLQNVADFTNLTFEGIAYNYVSNGVVSGNRTLKISSLPSYSFSPDALDTSTESNELSFNIDNDSSGNLAIQKIVLQFPYPFDSLLHVTNQIGATYLGTVSSLTLDYQAAGNQILAGDYDVVSVVLRDSFKMGNTNGFINVFADSGNGFVPIRIKNGGSNEIAIQMPDPNVFVSVYPAAIYLGSLTNHISVSLSNIGSGSSELTFARVILPEGFEDLHNLISAHGGIFSMNSNVVTLDYRTNRIGVGGSDKIEFDFINNIMFLTNVSVRVETANTSNDVRYIAAQGSQGVDQIVSLTYPPLFAEAYFQSDYHLYTIETNALLPYRIVNRSYQTSLTQVRITLETNIFNSIALDLSNSRASSYQWDSVSNTFTIDYTANPLHYMESDVLNLDLTYHLSNLTTLTLNTHVWVSGSTNADFDTLQLIAYHYNFLQVTNSSWGVIEGSVFPQWKSVDIKLYAEGESTVMTDVNGKVLSKTSDVQSGRFQISRIPSGIYDVEYSAPYYRTFVTNGISILDNQISILSVLTMRNAPLNSGSDQEVLSYENTNTRVIVPKGVVDQDFSIDIKQYELTSPQKSDISVNESIQDVADKDGLSGYYFDLRDYDDRMMDGAALKSDAILVLAYDQTNQLDRGWKESDLAVYYWDDTGQNGKWIRIGGQVNTESKTLVAKVSYLHRYYAIFGSNGGEGVIRNVNVRPRIFTPGNHGGYFDTIRISFEFDQVYDGFKLKIYDLKNDLIRSFERQGSYSQGEVVWDGLDQEGYPVKSGVYVYRVIAGNKVFAGTIIIAR